MVVDPIRCLHKNEPQVKAFRAYPPEYKSPVQNQCPDGSVEADERIRLEKWGSCWDRYYEIDVDYFMSEAAKNVLDVLTQNLWMRALGTTTAGLISDVTHKVNHVQKIIKEVDKGSILNLKESERATSSDYEAGVAKNNFELDGEKKQNDFLKVSLALAKLATEEVHDGLVQDVKKKMF